MCGDPSGSILVFAQAEVFLALLMLVVGLSGLRRDRRAVARVMAGWWVGGLVPATVLAVVASSESFAFPLGPAFTCPLMY